MTSRPLDREPRRIEPPAFPVIEVVPVHGDHGVLALKVAAGIQGPFTFDGRPYLRQGPQTLVMPRGRYEDLLLERRHATRRWENDPVPLGVGLRDLDQDEIRRVLNAAIQRGRMEQPVEQDIPAILRGLGLIRDGALLQAALAFFGHAFQLLHRAESFLLDHTQIASRVLPKREREDLPAYLPAVTREALANALCHRDYAQASGNLSVAMYDDRLEIANPGGLHFGLPFKFEMMYHLCSNRSSCVRA